jgi:hypothetical protein
MVIDDLANVGVAAMNPHRKFHASDAIRIEQLSASPANPSREDIYCDGIINRLRVFDGLTLQNCW